MSWSFLSYELSPELSAYGNGSRIEIKKTREMCCGDTSNNTELNFATHFGTHLDFPFHFSVDGMTSSNYEANDFIFNHISLYELDVWDREEKLISSKDLREIPSDHQTEALIIKTQYCHYRMEESYWKNNPGFQPEVADQLKSRFPKLRLIGFDSISLTNYQNRELGREAHKQFLVKNNLLILEDMDLRTLNPSSKIEQMIIAPLKFINGDGAPATVMARLK